MKKIFSLFLCAALLASMFMMSGCAQKDPRAQLEMPEKGDEIAIITTNYGDVTVRFFPKSAPKAVENFVTHARDGYYNGLTFHRVMNDFMIQGGDPTGTGRGGESIWGAPFEDEFDPNLMNIRGALCMANSGPATNGSQFFIVQAGAQTFNGWEYFKSAQQMYAANDIVYDYNSWNDEQKAVYEENGGTPWLDGGHRTDGKGHTVFGQVISGMDVVDKIAAVETDEMDKPIEPVIIQNIEVTTYQG